jgi:hypothetical protein
MSGAEFGIFNLIALPKVGNQAQPCGRGEAIIANRRRIETRAEQAGFEPLTLCQNY